MNLNRLFIDSLRPPHPLERLVRWLAWFATGLAWLTLILACVIASTARAEPSLRVFVDYDHRSDLFTGWPASNPPGREPTEDAVTVGAEFEWPMLRLSLSHGLYARECTITRHCDWESGTRLTLRRYFGPRFLLTGKRKRG